MAACCIRIDLVDFLEPARIAHLSQNLIGKRYQVPFDILGKMFIDVFCVATDFDGDDVFAVV